MLCGLYSEEKSLEKNKAPLSPLLIPSVPFEWLSVDAVGPLPTSYSDNRFLL